MPTKICKDCKKEFHAPSTYGTRYPRKYCDKCSAKRKKEYENIHNVCVGDCEEE